MQIRPGLLILSALCILSSDMQAARPAPISLHPANPHYFLWRGKPTVLITSGEHYGAVLNLDFGYVTYLETLKKDGLNLTRTFTGAYVEPQGAFHIARNTLAPSPGRFVCPWARGNVIGYGNGGRKFDLTKWDPAYFQRLKDFVLEASKHGVIVEMNLFCPFYEEAQWKLSPQNGTNNVNNVGNVRRTDVYTLDKNGGLLPFQEAMVRKIVSELKDFDNVYYEICNEAYFGGVTLEWQHHIADVITETEKSLNRKHLISQNIANNKALVENPHPQISIFNFHYASPPDAVGMNYHLNKVIGDNETGFAGTNDFPYRREAWEFIIAGGGLFNNLDYSFTTDTEDGTFIYPASQPGGGNPAYRRQLSYLKDFINGFDFIHMRPDTNTLWADLPVGVAARGLSNMGREYAFYFCLSPKSVDHFSVVWTGQIEPKQTGKYTFYTSSDDGVRLFIGDAKLIDNWTTHSATEDSGTIDLAAKKKYDVRLEYFQASGGAAMKLFWSGPGLKKEIVPESQFSTGEGRKGLSGQYYYGTNFENLKMSRVDKNIDFDWTNKSPFAASKVDEDKEHSFVFDVELPPGRYRFDWIDPLTGHVIDKLDKQNYKDPYIAATTPPFKQDLALRVLRQ